MRTTLASSTDSSSTAYESQADSRSSAFSPCISRRAESEGGGGDSWAGTDWFVFRVRSESDIDMGRATVAISTWHRVLYPWLARTLYATDP